MKYQNKSNGVIAELIQMNDRFKTVDLLKEDGKETTISQSTFKRWWKAIPEEEKTEEKSANDISNEIAADFEASEEEEKLAGDGTPYSEVMKEIQEGAKQKAKKAKETKKSSTSASKAHKDIEKLGLAANVQELAEYITDKVLELGGGYSIREDDHIYINYTLPGSKHIKAYTYIQKKSVQFQTRDRFIDTKLQKKMHVVTTQLFNCKLKMEELSEKNKELLDKLINNILENIEKEEK